MRFYKIPNEMFEIPVSSSAFVVYTVLSNHFYFKSCIKVKLYTISRLTGLSINTIRTALDELQSSGYINIYKRFDIHGNCTTSKYQIIRSNHSFTAIDRKTFFFILRTCGKAALYVYSAIRKCQNANGKAFPSYKQLMAMTGLSKTSCINKVSDLGTNGVLLKSHYLTHCGDFGHNNYASISTKLRYFLFNILCSIQKSRSVKLCRLLKNKIRIYAVAKGCTKIDKHIQDQPKNDKKLKRTVNCIAFSTLSLHRKINNIYCKAKKFLKIFRNTFCNKVINHRLI